MSAPEVVFVCWGNICRSPMAAVVTANALDEAGVDARVTSAGISAEEQGNPMDRRAQRVLTEAGFAPGPHRAHQITAAEAREADLLVAAEDFQAERLRAMAPNTPVALITDFDPDATPGSPLPDPWYGGQQDFEKTLQVLERAAPALVERIGGLGADTVSASQPSGERG